MKPILFTMGGAGNVYYQYNFVNKICGENIFVSNIMYSKIFKILLGHTANYPKHERQFEEAGCLMLSAYTLIFIFDLFLVKIFSKSLFTFFDTTNYKLKPINKPLIYFGYFQSKEFSPFEPKISANIFLQMGDNKKKSTKEICIHIRGGDYLVAHNKNSYENTNMPIPSFEWYKKSLDLLTQEPNAIKNINIVTDDLSFSEDIYNQLQRHFSYYNINCESKSFNSDLNSLLNAEFLIIYNSTFALMAAESNTFLKKAIISNYLASKSLSENLASKSILLDN